MSHDATAWARKQQVGNSPAKFLLMMLADFAGSDYSCWPGQDKLASLTEMSERTIRRATTLLVDQGLIRVFYRYRDDRTRRSCRYQLLVDGLATEVPETVDWSRMRQAEPGDPPDSVTDEPPDSVTTPTGQAVQTYRSESPVLPSKEPSVVEPSVMNPGASRTARGSRLPENFSPDEGLRKWYAAEQLENVISGRIEHQKFMNYWLSQPGTKGRKIDWRRTWMNWMLSAAQRARPQTGGAVCKPSTTDQRVAQGLALAEKFRQMEEAGEL